MSTVLVMAGRALSGVMVATPLPAATAKSISSMLGLPGLAYRTWPVSALVCVIASRSEPGPLSAVVVTT